MPSWFKAGQLGSKLFSPFLSAPALPARAVFGASGGNWRILESHDNQLYGASSWGQSNGWGTTGGHHLVTTKSLSDGAVMLPGTTILLADSNPRPDGLWSMSMWFPTIIAANEGVDTRHGGARATTGKGNIIFADGHAGRLRDADVNDPVRFRNRWDPRWPSETSPWW